MTEVYIKEKSKIASINEIFDADEVKDFKIPQKDQFIRFSGKHGRVKGFLNRIYIVDWVFCDYELMENGEVKRTYYISIVKTNKRLSAL